MECRKARWQTSGACCLHIQRDGSEVGRGLSFQKENSVSIKKKKWLKTGLRPIGRRMEAFIRAEREGDGPW